VLREAGAIELAALPTLAPHEQIREAYSHYPREDRGLARRSIVHHLLLIRLFLREMCLAALAERRWRNFRSMPIQSAQFVAWDACFTSCLFAIAGNLAYRGLLLFGIMVK
jgi:hypothetical protein